MGGQENGQLWRELYLADRSKRQGGGRNVKCFEGWRLCIHMCQGAAGLNDLISRGASEEEIELLLRRLSCSFLNGKVASAKSKAERFGEGRDELEERIEEHEFRCGLLEEKLKTAVGKKKTDLERQVRQLRGGIQSSKRYLENLDELLQS